MFTTTHTCKTPVDTHITATSDAINVKSKFIFNYTHIMIEHETLPNNSDNICTGCELIARTWRGRGWGALVPS